MPNKNFEQIAVTGNTNPGLIAMRSNASEIGRLNNRQFTPAYGKKTRTMEHRIIAAGSYVKESDSAASVILVLKTLDLVESAMNPNGIKNALKNARETIKEKTNFEPTPEVKEVSINKIRIAQMAKVSPKLKEKATNKEETKYIYTKKGKVVHSSKTMLEEIAGTDGSKAYFNAGSFVFSGPVTITQKVPRVTYVNEILSSDE